MKRFFLLVGCVMLLAGCNTAGVPAPVTYPLQIDDAEFNVEIADTPTERAIGLSQRTELAEDSGMLFTFPEAGVYIMWMKDTLIPLDMIWIAAGKVIYFQTDVQPQPGVSDADLKQYAPQIPVTEIVELPAGTIESEGISIGDPVVLPRP